MRINRAGTRSTFGGIIFMGVSQGKPISLSHLSENALYAETSSGGTNTISSVTFNSYSESISDDRIVYMPVNIEPYKKLNM